ncbi:MAG: zinc-ribbon domain-containing protein [Candidatus Heimdallarchaeota archaeon]
MSSEQFCPFCGSTVKEGDVFCNNCGASLEETPEPTPVATVQQPTDFSYTDSPQIVVTPTKLSDTNIFAYVAIGCGIGALILAIIPFIGYLAPICAIVSIVCGGIGLGKKLKRNMAIAGLTLGITAIVLWIVLWILARFLGIRLW